MDKVGEAHNIVAWQPNGISAPHCRAQRHRCGHALRDADFHRRSVYFPSTKGKRTLVLSDLEIDRAKKNAKADEFVMFSQLEREVQGKAKQRLPTKKVLAHFLTKRGVKRALVRLISPGWALLTRLSEMESHWKRATAFLAGAGEENSEEIRLLERALRMTEAGMKRAMEILKASNREWGKN